jgi:DAK2 domain fusion protein YloV
VTDVEQLRSLVAAAAASIEASRDRIDDLNVYPVPDGDTGTNIALTVRSLADELDRQDDAPRSTLAHAVTRAALMGARGNSGVILSQIVRGAAEVLGEAASWDADAIARAFRGASDTAYRGVRKPVEGTMLTVVREMAEAAEERAGSGNPAAIDLLRAVLERGEEALARTPQLLDVLRDAGVVDAGGAGLVELVRGLAAEVAGEALPPPPAEASLGFDAVHRELSEYRYCTTFVVEGKALDREELERELGELGDSLLVVGDESALRVHVHTDDPGVALSMGTARGVLAGVEIANMHAQTAARERRLSETAAPEETRTADVVAVVAGAGNRNLYEGLGARAIVEGGQSMNPSTAEILEAISSAGAPEVVVLPNNGNVIMSAEQAATLAGKPVRVVPTRSIQAGLAALLAYDPRASAADNASAMEHAAAALATAAVTVASRDVDLDGLRVRTGDYLGLLEEEPLVGGESFDDVAAAVVSAALGEEHEVLTLLAGEDAPELASLLARVEEAHPDVEVDVQEGGQPHYALLISAE